LAVVTTGTVTLVPTHGVPSVCGLVPALAPKIPPFFQAAIPTRWPITRNVSTRAPPGPRARSPWSPFKRSVRSNRILALNAQRI
jgi:hypothetical protein